MKQVRIYTTDYCGYCRRAKEFLTRRGIPFEEIDVTTNDAMRAELVRMSNGQRTVPQIFIGDQHVGGYSDMMALESEGKLDPMLQ